MIFKRLLILSFIGSIFLTGYGQHVTNKETLLSLADKLEKRHLNKKATAVKYAREKGIPITQTLDNGTFIELQFVENGRPVYYGTQNLNAAVSVRVDRLWTGGGLGLDLDGSGFSELGLWDAGAVRRTHDEFNNTGITRVNQEDKTKKNNFHSTHIAGTLIGGGLNPDAKGMAYNGNLKAWDWNRDESEIATAAARGLEISNHSYGFMHGWSGSEWYGDVSVSVLEDFWFGFYSEHTAELDDIAYNAPNYLYVKSAGNDRGEEGDGSYPPDGNQGSGYDCVGTRASAKNILTVGSVEDLAEYQGPSSVLVSPYSAWGPVDDGRIKPDIVANGANLFSSLETGDAAYGVLYGTSMANANASGTLALLKEHYMNTHGGAIMKAATLKALVIHTADECGPFQGPDYMYGWGLLNAEAAAAKITEDNDDDLDVIQELVINNGDTNIVDINVDGTQPLIVTICWTDPPGTPVADQLDPKNHMLVNDLNLAVLGNSTTYYPWKLNGDNPSAAASNTGENDVDNVETVFIPSVSPGVYTIEVSHEGDIGSGQYYSLIISGATSIVQPDPEYCDSHGNALNEWINQVTIGSNDPILSGTSGAKGYQDKTDEILIVDANSEVPVTLVPGFDPRSKFEYWSVWIDFNADKDFDDEGELLFTSSKSKTTVIGTLIIPDIPDVLTRMRISMSRSGTPGSCDILDYGEVEDYSIQIGQGTPPELTADFDADNNDVLIGNAVNFNDLSTGSPTSWEWTFEGGVPATSTDQNPTIVYNSAGTYDVGLVISDGVDTDEEIKTAFIVVGDVSYCNSEGLNFDQEWIAGVAIEGVFSNTGPEPPLTGYSYFDGMGITLNEATEYSITLSPGFSGKAQREFWRVWIDYDGDMSFSTEELVFSADNKKADVTDVFIIPAVSSKDTRMRVSMSRGSAPPVCGDIEFGEVEDYIISLTGTQVDGGKAGMIDRNEPDLLSIYPNPGNTLVNVKYTGELNNAGLKIYNIQGARLMDLRVVSNDLKLDISGFTPGVYFLVFRSGEHMIYKKLIRQ